MAVNFDYVGKRQQLFQAKPDVQMNIKLDDGEHAWIFKNSASFLRTETTRYFLEIQSIAQNAQDMQSMGDDEKAQQEFAEGKRAATERFRSAFKASVTSEDGSSDKWIDDNINDIELLGTMLTEMIKVVRGAK